MPTQLQPPQIQPCRYFLKLCRSTVSFHCRLRNCAEPIPGIKKKGGEKKEKKNQNRAFFFFLLFLKTQI